MAEECGFNMTAGNVTGLDTCVGGLWYQCKCRAEVICCSAPGVACPNCVEHTDDPSALFSFSWPLVAGWYAMLVVLFCFGRRGRFVNRFCLRRRREPDVEAPNDDLEITPVVKTRLLQEADIVDDPVCTICLSPLLVGEQVAALECPHLYHADCIVEWLRRKNSCPLCAQRIDAERVMHHPSTTPPVLRTEETPPPPARTRSHDDDTASSAGVSTPTYS